MKARCTWIRPTEGRSAALWSSGGVGSAAVLCLPGIGYAFSSGYRLLTTVSAALEERDWSTHRLHYSGTGDGAGDLPDLDSLRADLAAAAAALRDAGAEQILFVGVEVGAGLGLEYAANSEDVSGVVGLGAVLSGRRHARRLALLASNGPSDSAAAVGGYPVSRRLLEQLKGWDPLAFGVPSVPVLLLGPTEGAAPEDAAGVDDPTIGAVLSEVAEEVHDVSGPAATVAEWVPRAPASPTRPAPGTSVLDLGGVVERSVALADTMVAVETVETGEAARDRPADVVVILLNSGSDPHCGPGGAWVDVARALVGPGTRVLRTDFRGWGESTPSPHVPRPYARTSVEDTAALVAAVRTWQPQARVILSGLCAGAQLALRPAVEGPAVDAVLAVNPQLYWLPGMPVIPMNEVGEAFLLGEIDAVARGSASNDPLHAAGLDQSAHWLRALSAGDAVVRLLFSEGDGGLEFLRRCVPEDLAAAAGSGRVAVLESVGLDHGMTTLGSRRVVTGALAELLRDLRSA